MTHPHQPVSAARAGRQRAQALQALQQQQQSQPSSAALTDRLVDAFPACPRQVSRLLDAIDSTNEFVAQQHRELDALEEAADEQWGR